MDEEKRRAEIMKVLYETYMGPSPWTSNGWTSQGGRDSEFASFYREAEWLRDHGLIQCKVSHSSISDARITTLGREQFEAGVFGSGDDDES